MITKRPGLVRAISIIAAIIILNFSLISNLEYSAGQSELSNDDLRPELNNYWEYKRSDYSDSSVYRYNLTMTGETIIKVGNKDINVLILEGYGYIEKWPNNLEPADQNKMYIKKLINKENLELVKYTQYIDLVYIEDENVYNRYIHENHTYNYITFTKPTNITIGSNWSKSVIRTEEKNIKRDAGEPQKMVHQDQVNSTLLVDNVYYVMVKAGAFNTLMVLERQWHEDIIDTTIEYYYTAEVNGYAKKIRRDFSGDIVELEELIRFEKGTPPINDNNKKNDTTENWLDLNNRTFQIVLIISVIIIVCIIIGYIRYRQN